MPISLPALARCVLDPAPPLACLGEITSDFRPPHSSRLFTATATAVRAMQFYMPEELSGERDAVIRRARDWLVASRPQSTEAAAFRLMGVVWSDASSIEVDAARHDLVAQQRPDGGWSQLPRSDSDAYSTGEALYALQVSRSPTRHGGRGSSF
jgi:hypothetical protein